MEKMNEVITVEDFENDSLSNGTSVIFSILESDGYPIASENDPIHLEITVTELTNSSFESKIIAYCIKLKDLDVMINNIQEIKHQLKNKLDGK